jgi:hypothetical protein
MWICENNKPSGFRRQSYEGQFVVTPAKPRDQVSPAQRSRVTNGKRLFAVGGDMRSPWVRRYRDVEFIHTADLGGSAAISGAEASLIRRIATLTVELERKEAKFSEAEPSDDAFDSYQRGVNTLRRLLETIGLQRRPRDVTENPNYLAVEYETSTADEHS